MSTELKHTCHECGGHIGYAQDAFGATIFCPHCGRQTTLGEVYPSGPSGDLVVPANPAPAHDTPQTPSGQSSTASQVAWTRPPSSRNAKAITIVVVGLALLIGLGLFRAVSSKGQPEPAPTTSSVERQRMADAEAQRRQELESEIDRRAAEQRRQQEEKDKQMMVEQEEMEELVGLAKHLDATIESVQSAWNKTVGSRFAGATQIGTIRDQILPLVRNSESRIQRFQPKTEYGKRVKTAMLDLTQFDRLSWVNIYNAAVSGKWFIARGLFDRMEIDRESKADKLNKAISSKTSTAVL